MSGQSERLAQLFLRYAPPLAALRRLPMLGPWVSWAGGKLVPRNSLAWVQVRRGAAQGLWLHLNPRTGRAYFEGQGEPEVQAALREHLRPGMTFYDIGANIGFFSLPAARLVGKEGQVVAFEADPEIAARLREHAERNGFPWIKVEEKAVWSAARTVQFERGNTGNAIEVEAVSMDEYTRATAAPDFVKCDVEGAEVEVIRGARQLMREKRPGILCEMHGAENHRILLEEFARLGYGCEACGPAHVLALPK